MKNNTITTQRPKTVIAISQQDDKLFGVCLEKDDNGFKVVWAKSCDRQDGFGIFNKPAEVDDERIVVAGFEPASVGFYRIEMPEVKEKELDAMIKLQVEARLPLGLDRIELAWRVGAVKNGQVSVTIAAARKEPLQRFVDEVRNLKPAKIMLNCEGLVRIWRELAGTGISRCVVVTVNAKNSMLCLTENGELTNMSVVDVGSDDLTGNPVQSIDRFRQDCASVLESFGCEENKETPMFVVSDGSEGIEELVSSLNSAGMEAREFRMSNEEFRIEMQEEQNLYEYRVAMGLALMALDPDVGELNLFDKLYMPKVTETGKSWASSLKKTAAVTIVTVFLFVIALYAGDVLSNKSLNQLKQEGDCGKLIKRQKLLRETARNRINLLELLKTINSCEADGVTLDEIRYKKRQLVNLSGNTAKTEQIYKFQKALTEVKSIRDVKIRSQSQDKKSKKVKFTLTFNYKHFTKKK
ncbi:hypothetical protein ACFL3G_04185 [Planctomycetota bacterium]